MSTFFDEHPVAYVIQNLHYNMADRVVNALGYQESMNAFFLHRDGFVSLLQRFTENRSMS
jgi:hypothetical protein